MTRITSLTSILLMALATFGCDGDSVTAPTDMSQVLQNTVSLPSLSIALKFLIFRFPQTERSLLKSRGSTSSTTSIADCGQETVRGLKSRRK